MQQECRRISERHTVLHFILMSFFLICRSICLLFIYLFMGIFFIYLFCKLDFMPTKCVNNKPKKPVLIHVIYWFFFDSSSCSHLTSPLSFGLYLASLWLVSVCETGGWWLNKSGLSILQQMYFEVVTCGFSQLTQWFWTNQHSQTITGLCFLCHKHTRAYQMLACWLYLLR